MAKLKWNFTWGIVITLVFLLLLAARLDVFQTKTPDNTISPTIEISRSPESWMNIYQNKNKIGVIHRKFNILDNGRFQTEEFVTMQINTMGVLQVFNVLTETELNPDMTFSSFNFEINSSLFRFTARGYAGKDKLILYAGLPHALQKTIIPFKDVPHISGNIYEAAFRGGLEKDKTRDFSIFDPSTLALRKISVTRQSNEIIPIMGKRVLTQKFCADFMGAKNCAWLAKDGEVLKETGMLGLSMEKVGATQAKEGFTSREGVDFTQVASIPSNRNITAPSKLTEIKIKIDGIRDLPLLLQSGRQYFHKNILTITREKIPDTVSQNNIPAAILKYLQPSPLVQSSAPEMKTQVEKIIIKTDSPQIKLQKIVQWVYRTIEKKPVLSVPNAMEVLNNKAGDCNEHAVLTAALLRSAGIPAQIETGLVYLNGRFYYHAWNLAYIGQWVTADAVFNQIPADVTHIRLAGGEGGEQLDLLGVMGKIKLEVLSTKND
ncbi:MAG TPA: transglutaminase-like domain-containing protein [Smithellaceae bacterium]|nr:transglutaminase-like domain-containing protein [Smithellaceae bacterium]